MNGILYTPYLDKIIKLLKSPVMEDTLVGLSLLVKSYNRGEITDIFYTHGDGNVFNKEGYLADRCFLRHNKYETGWVLACKDDIGFYIGVKLFITSNNAHAHRICRDNNYKVIEL